MASGPECKLSESSESMLNALLLALELGKRCIACHSLYPGPDCLRCGGNNSWSAISSFLRGRRAKGLPWRLRQHQRLVCRQMLSSLPARVVLTLTPFWQACHDKISLGCCRDSIHGDWCACQGMRTQAFIAPWLNPLTDPCADACGSSEELPRF